MYPTFPSFRRQPPDAPQHRFDTLPFSVLGFPLSAGLGFAVGQPTRRHARPNRVRHPTDRWFTSGCSPPRLTAMQLPSVTGRRAHAWRGLAPLRSSTLSGALAHVFRHGGIDDWTKSMSKDVSMNNVHNSHFGSLSNRLVSQGICGTCSCAAPKIVHHRVPLMLDHSIPHL